MKLHFVWIGKTKDRNCAALTEGYLERIRRFCPVEVSELRESDSGIDEKRIIEAEGRKILEAVGKDDLTILLDEKGEEFSSTKLAEYIDKRRQGGVKRAAFVIGGFAGVSDEVRKRADTRLSLSRMTLTHELARVILTEQVYRAFTLLSGLPYHRS